MTRTLLLVLKPTRSPKELFDKSKQGQRWFNVAYPNVGGTVRWNVIVTDKMAEKIRGATFDVTFGAKVSDKPIPSTAWVWLHQFGQQMLHGMFMGFVLRAAGGW